MSLKVLLALGVFPVVAGCATRATAVPAAAWEPAGKAVCATAGNNPVWGDSLEQAAIAATGGRVRRLGCRLVFNLPDGRVHEIADGFPPEEPPLRATYRGPISPWALDLVEVTFEEEVAYYVVNGRGTRALIAGHPIPAPGGRRFAAESFDLEAGYQDNVIEIWRVDEQNEPSLDLALKAGDWGPSDLVWRDSVTLGFMQNFPTTEIGVYRKVAGVIRRIGDRWIIELAAR
jgi:hypothetical protein